MIFDLALPAFLAGILTFLMPCTLPLVPGYLSFIGGASLAEVSDPKIRRRIVMNGIGYVLGFSVVFILFGSVFAAAGIFTAAYRPILARIGGLFIIFLGFYMIGAFRLAFFEKPLLNPVRAIQPGRFPGAFLFGAIFALGWTPCIGPILGTILTLAVTTGSVAEGAILLSIFSLGLAIPFLLSAFFIGSVARHIGAFTRVMRVVSIGGGVLLIFLGFLIATDRFGWWVSSALELVPAGPEWFLKYL